MIFQISEQKSFEILQNKMTPDTLTIDLKTQFFCCWKHYM